MTFKSFAGTPKTAAAFLSLAASLGDAWANVPSFDHPILKSNPEPFYYTGNGTQASPYLIPDLETLEVFRWYVNNARCAACSGR